MPEQLNKPKEISDSDLLLLIELGLLLIVDPQLPRPRLFFRGAEIQAELNMQGGRRDSFGCLLTAN